MDGSLPVSYPAAPENATPIPVRQLVRKEGRQPSQRHGDGLPQVADPEQLQPGKFGIPAPGEECPAVDKGEIGVVLVPCLLCDRQGYRLGYGGGYYDRWLADLQGLTVCICPEERLVDELPREGFDVPVQLVLS